MNINFDSTYNTINKLTHADEYTSMTLNFGDLNSTFGLLILTNK